MIVVSDTSPVANLILIDRLEILHQIFGEIVIPTFVDTEIKELEQFGKNIEFYQQATWIRIEDVENISKVEALKKRLDKGEAEAIILALELNCNLILIDERIGTRIAREEGLKTIGLLGVLIKAKEMNIIKELKPILGELREKAGFWLGDKLLKQILFDQKELFEN